MSILINKDTRVITQGITGKTGQFHTRMCVAYAHGKNCFVAGVNPKKAGEDFEGIPIYASVQDAKAQTGATVSVIYVPPAGAAAAIWEAVQADLDLAICITEGIPIKDMLEVRNRMKAKEAAGWQEDAAAGAELPGHDHARGDQDRHHAGAHPQEGPHRGGQPQRHADLRGGGAADRDRPGPELGGGHRR
jgi:succinyl-CoA synthetase alpha subunit